MPQTQDSCRIVILNYNGQALLKACLPSIVEAASKSKYACKVTVLDNQSADESERLIAEEFPSVTFTKSPSNRLLCSYNAYLESIPEERVILLNNDIRVESNFIDPLLDVFDSHPDAFFAAMQSLDEANGQYEGSLSKLEFHRGLLWGSSRFEGYEAKINKPMITMQCGFGAFLRSRFLELGGYDDLYLPGTVEDTDLCFRGYRRGWKGYYCPESVVHHRGQSSFKRAFGVSGIQKINRRNLYLFVWKNIRHPILMTVHLLWIPFHLLKYICFGQFDFLKGFAAALGRLPQALAKRRQAARTEKSKISDPAIFEFSKGI